MSEQEYEFHPYAAVLPMMGQTELNELAADIQGSGLRHDIILLDGKILDGRNRYKACEIASVEPRFRDFNGDGDPIDFIVSVNIKRRHLTAAQREMVAAKLADLPRGDVSRITKQTKTPTVSQTAKRQFGKTKGKTTIAEAAKELDVSPRNVARAKEALRTAPTEEIEAIERGEKKVGTVVRETREKAASTEKHFDKTGYPIPNSILADWQRAQEFGSTLREISRIKSALKKGLDESDLIFAEVSNTTVSTLTNAYGDLKRVLPYSVCPTCQGRTPKKCTTCRSRGFVSEFYYTTCVPEETKTIREKAIKK